jgi:hypothetical protein
MLAIRFPSRRTRRNIREEGAVALHGIDLQNVEWKRTEEIWEVAGLKGEGPGIRVSSGGLGYELNSDPETGAKTWLIKLPAGWKTAAPEVHSARQEYVLLEGDITFAEEDFEAPTYFCVPAHSIHGPTTTKEGCVMVLMHAGPFDISYPEVPA